MPLVQGLRVEVNGQVLSKGGDVGADQVMDTTAETTLRYAHVLCSSFLHARCMHCWCLKTIAIVRNRLLWIHAWLWPCKRPCLKGSMGAAC